MFLKFVYFFSLIFISKSSCPNGSIEWKSDCYKYIKNGSEFAMAEITCNNNGGHLVSIHDAFTNIVIGQEAQNNFQESTEVNFWVGGNNLEESGNWSWTDDSSFAFNDWKKGEPQNASGLNCIAVSMTDGFWSAQDCFKSKPYVCKITALPVTTTATITTTLAPSTTTKPKPLCPEGWVYFNYTGYCYGIYHNQNGPGAEQVCNIFGGHLVIHSNMENNFVGNLPFQPGHIWLGFQSLNGGEGWFWTDDTSASYTNWAPGEPNGRGGTGCTEFYGYHQWNDVPCNQQYDNFVCKKFHS